MDSSTSVQTELFSPGIAGSNGHHGSVLASNATGFRHHPLLFTTYTSLKEVLLTNNLGLDMQLRVFGPSKLMSSLSSASDSECSISY